MPGRADAFRDAAMPALNLRYLAAVILVDGHLDVAAASSLERLHHDEEVIARRPRSTWCTTRRRRPEPGGTVPSPLASR